MQCDKMQVLDIIRKTNDKYNMFSPGDSVLVGLSGGADSVCLLHCLYTLREEFKISLSAAHLNHGIRGEEADCDAELAAKLCRNLNIPFYIKKVDVPAYAKSEGVSEETAGRLVRYRFFNELCNDKKIKKIATAHNRNDQAETVLMRIIRGTGIDGMAGIRYCRENGIVRPILNVSRELIEGYCRECNLEYCTDSTNAQNEYTRNRIRNKLIPMLKEEFNPGIIESLASLAQRMSEDGDFINGYAGRLYKRINSPAPSRKPVVLDTESLKMLDVSIQTRLIRLAAEDAMGKGYSLDSVHLEAVQELLDKETGCGVSLPKGLYVAVRYGWLAFETPVDCTDKTFADNIHYEVELGKTYDFEDYWVSLRIKDEEKPLKKNQMLADYDSLKDMPLEIRCRKRGDRISVYKDGRSRKLKSFMIDQKIPLSKRDFIPLLCSGSEVIAVVGYRVAEPYKINKDTKTELVIEYETGDKD